LDLGSEPRGKKIKRYIKLGGPGVRKRGPTNEGGHLTRAAGTHPGKLVPRSKSRTKNFAQKKGGGKKRIL